MEISTIKKKIKDILIYFMGSVLCEAVLFFLLPIYTNYLIPEELGYFDVLKTYSTFIINFCFLQIHTVVLRFFFEKSKEDVITNSIVLVLISSLVSSIAIIGMSLFITIEYKPLLILYTLTSALATYFSYIARGSKRNILFAVSGLIATCINVAINIVLIVFFKCGYISLYIAGIFSYLIQCLVIGVKLHIVNSIKRSSFNSNTVVSMIKYGFPIALNLSAYWYLTSYSKTVITDKLGTYYNGMFSVATKFTTILSIMSNCILMVWQETSFSKYEDIKKDSNKIGIYYSQSNRFALCFIIYCAALLLPTIRVLFPIVINSTFNEALPMVPLAIIGMIVNVYCSYLTSIFTAIKKNYDMLIASVIGAIANVILANVLVKKYMIDGVNVAMIIGFLVNAIIRILALKKRINLKLDFRKCIIPILLMIAAYYIYIYMKVWINLLFGIIVFIILLIDLYKEIKGTKLS